MSIPTHLLGLKCHFLNETPSEPSDRTIKFISSPQILFFLIVSGHFPSFTLTLIISLCVYLFNAWLIALNLLASYVYCMCFIHQGIVNT